MKLLQVLLILIQLPMTTVLHSREKFAYLLYLLQQNLGHNDDRMNHRDRDSQFRSSSAEVDEELTHREYVSVQRS